MSERSESNCLVRLVRHLQLAFWMTLGSFFMWILGMAEMETFVACAWFSHVTLATQFLLKTSMERSMSGIV